jgi:hypothetical protein
VSERNKRSDVTESLVSERSKVSDLNESLVSEMNKRSDLNESLVSDTTSMLWIQEIIYLLDRSGGAHRSGLQLLRAKLDSIKHFESYGDLLCVPSIVSLLGGDPEYSVSILRRLSVDS